MKERSRRPRSCPHQTPEIWKARLLEVKARFHYGPKKLRSILMREYPGTGVPAASTLGKILSKEGLVCRRRIHRKWPRQPLVEHALATAPNQVWAIDFKGWFRTADGARCDPLTVSDLHSRYVLCCRLVRSQSFREVQPVLLEIFRRYGLPEHLRSDNGAPFGSNGAGGLSRLSIWLLRLGIKPEFIEPSHPEQNGIHERMHRNLKAWIETPSADWPSQQQALERWRLEYNNQRPHEALGQRLPSEVYFHSSRALGPSKPLVYPSGHCVRRVEPGGRINWMHKRFFIGKAFAHQPLGLKTIEPKRCQVYFSTRLLGQLYFDPLCRGLVPCKQVDQTKNLSPMCSV